MVTLRCKASLGAPVEDINSGDLEQERGLPVHWRRRREKGPPRTRSDRQTYLGEGVGRHIFSLIHTRPDPKLAPGHPRARCAHSPALRRPLTLRAGADFRHCPPHGGHRGDRCRWSLSRDSAPVTAPRRLETRLRRAECSAAARAPSPTQGSAAAGRPPRAGAGGRGYEGCGDRRARRASQQPRRGRLDEGRSWGAGAGGGVAGARAYSLPRQRGGGVGRGAGRNPGEPPPPRPAPGRTIPEGAGWAAPSLLFPAGRPCSASRLRLGLSFLNTTLTLLNLDQRGRGASARASPLVPSRYPLACDNNGVARGLESRVGSESDGEGREGLRRQGLSYNPGNGREARVCRLGGILASPGGHQPPPPELHLLPRPAHEQQALRPGSPRS